MYIYAGVCNCKDTYICIVSKGDLSFGANTRRGVLNGLYVVCVPYEYSLNMQNCNKLYFIWIKF